MVELMATLASTSIRSSAHSHLVVHGSDREATRAHSFVLFYRVTVQLHYATCRSLQNFGGQKRSL